MKLPVWPIWSGVIAQVLEWIGLADACEALLGTLGGRVIPVALDPSTGFPFLLLVHHRHSFTPFDIFRPLTKILLPEGFPAHPHAGFDTVTYCIDGGLRHRDSEGFKMAYGDGEVQWMRAGRGIIHEEMWDVPTEPKHQRIELFQLWVNLPEEKKYDPAAIHLLKREDIKSVSLLNGDVQVKVIAGECFGDNRVSSPSQGSEVAGSPIGIFHITSKLPMTNLQIDQATHAILYVRKGKISFVNSIGMEEKVTAGDMIVINSAANLIGMNISCDSKDGFDALLLAGMKLNQPVYQAGSFVDSSEEGIEISKTIFNSIGMQGFWDFTWDDQRWQEHCKQLRLGQLIKRARQLD